MTKYISLFGATTTDTQVQVVKENQVIIGIGAGASRKRYVVYKVEHTARGYVYHMVDTETKEISQTDILRPLSQTFGIGRYYDDVNRYLLGNDYTIGEDGLAYHDEDGLIYPAGWIPEEPYDPAVDWGANWMDSWDI